MAKSCWQDHRFDQSCFRYSNCRPRKLLLREHDFIYGFTPWMGLASVGSTIGRRTGANGNMGTSFSPRDFLFTLLLKVGVAASIAALLARWNTFCRVLFTEERDVDHKIKLMFFMVPPLILGGTRRLVASQYRLAGFSLDAAFLSGV